MTRIEDWRRVVSLQLTLTIAGAIAVGCAENTESMGGG